VHDVTRSIKESAEDFKEYKAFLVERGKRFAELCGGSRSRIAELGRPFIRDGATVGPSGTISTFPSLPYFVLSCLALRFPVLTPLWCSHLIYS